MCPLYESSRGKHQGYRQQHRRAQERAGSSKKARSDIRIPGETSTGILLVLSKALKS